MARAGTIDVDIRANSAQFVREMRRVRRSTEGVQKQLRGFARTAAGAFAAVFGVQQARNVLQVADNLEQFSRRIGVSARQLQAWQQVAKGVNIQTNQFNIALQRLERRAAEASRGTGEARDAFRELGIDAARFIELDLDNQLFDLSDAFSEVENSAIRAALAQKLFDSEGVQQLQLLLQRTEALREQRNEVQTWSDDTRKALADANTELALWGDQLIIVSGKILTFLREAGTPFVNWLTETRAGIGSYLESFATGFGAGVTQADRNQQAARGPTLPAVGGDMFGAGVLRPGFGVLQGSRPTSRGGPTEPLAPATGSIFTGPLEAIAQAQEAIREAQRQAYAAGQNAQIDFNRWRINEEKKTQEEQKRIREQYQEQFVNLFQQNLVQAADGSFREILNSWILTLQQMVAAAAASRIFDFLGGTSIGQSIGNFFGGARANGGPVMAGGAYLVGERGPEIFTPGRSGQIIPNGAGTIVQNITVNGGNRGELLAAMTVAKNAAVREVEDARRRS